MFRSWCLIVITYAAPPLERNVANGVQRELSSPTPRYSCNRRRLAGRRVPLALAQFPLPRKATLPKAAECEQHASKRQLATTGSKRGTTRKSIRIFSEIKTSQLTKNSSRPRVHMHKKYIMSICTESSHAHKSIRVHIYITYSYSAFALLRTYTCYNDQL